MALSLSFLLGSHLDLFLRTCDHNISESIMNPFAREGRSLMISYIIFLGVKNYFISGHLHIQITFAADEKHAVPGDIEINQFLNPFI